MSNVDQIRDIKALNPLCQVLLNLALAEIKAKGVTPLLVETYRPQSRQNWLYAQGRTRTGNKVTWTLNSIHTLKNAVDLIPQRGGKAIWNSNDSQTKIIIKTMEKYGFEAGANWAKNSDSPHFQIKGVGTDASSYSTLNNNWYITAVIQQALNKKLGLKLATDGCWGVKTTCAVNQFKKSFGWCQNGKLDSVALKKLLS